MMPDDTDNQDTAGSDSDQETVDAATELGEETSATAATETDDGDDGETFPRAYVEELRAENARYRERAKAADTLAQRLHTALVAATGRLQDPSDLPFDEAHLENSDAMAAAIDELLERKPHLKSRRVVGDVGQGAGGVRPGDVDLSALLRARA